MIHVEERAPGHYQIDWHEAFDDSPVSVAVAQSPSFAQTVALGSGLVGQGTFSELAPQTRHYFELTDDRGRSRHAAQRNVPLTGGVNFRDLGGYPTAQNRITKWGQIYRSGHLSHLTADDQRYLQQLNIRSVCDFRRAAEIKMERSSLPGSPATHQVPIVPGARDPAHIHHLFASTKNPHDVLDAMVEIMRILISDAAPQYKRLFEALLHHDDGSFLMNCSAGKERTGVGTILVLMALGVPREMIEYDFMLSGKYYPVESEVPRVIEKYDVTLPDDVGVGLVMPLLETHQAYIRAVFEEIDKRSDNDEAFIKKTYELTDKDLLLLREKYTENLS
ncbi:MAG: tyrosine-protein phosphatase [Pseudomonadota bacterium]